VATGINRDREQICFSELRSFDIPFLKSKSSFAEKNNPTVMHMTAIATAKTPTARWRCRIAALLPARGDRAELRVNLAMDR
jgi:hypothetical protein